MLSDEVNDFIEESRRWDLADLPPEEREEAERTRHIIEILVSEVVRGRETLSESQLPSAERLFEEHPELLEDFLDERFTRELIDSVRGCVRRTMELRRMEAVQTASQITNTYIREATRSYILGLPQACIALCRAALEQSLRDNLDRQLKSDRIPFQELLTEARRWNLLDDITMRAAHDVANAGNDVLHEKPTDLNKARDVLDKLRGLVQQIYSAEGHY